MGHTDSLTLSRFGWHSPTMPIDVDGDEDVDTNYHEHKQLKRWEHALLDLRKGHNIGCHKYCDALNVKLLYMTFGTLLWILVGSFCFAALEHKDMQKYQKGAHDFDGMVSTLRNVSNSGVMPLPGANLNFTKRQLTHAANFMANNKPAHYPCARSVLLHAPLGKMAVCDLAPMRAPRGCRKRPVFADSLASPWGYTGIAPAVYRSAAVPVALGSAPSCAMPSH